MNLSTFILFMCGWKRALQRCNSDSAKIMNALEMKWGLVPLSSSFLGPEKTKKTFNKFYQKTVNLFQDKTPADKSPQNNFSLGLIFRR